MTTAIDIKTELWIKILNHLIDNSWGTVYKYNGLDGGVDFDLVILRKDGEEILLGWDNWIEGEIQCSEKNIHELEKLTKQKFRRGEPKNLLPEVVALYWQDK